MLKLIYFFYFFRFKSRGLDDLYKRVAVRSANYLLRFYYSATGPFTTKRVLKNTDDPELIVSLTTYPARIGKVWMVIETLLDQTLKPDKIILWLYEGEFNGLKSLPDRLRNLENRGLDIRFCEENLYPHKKYFYTMREFPGTTVITVDDDVFYPSGTVEDLLKHREKFPGAIICSLSRRMRIKNGRPLVYGAWEYETERTKPLYRNLMIGAGGVLYPDGSLHGELFNLDNLKQYALKTDDLWLKVMSMKAGTKVACSFGSSPRLFIPIIRNKDQPLMAGNIGENKNDSNFTALLEKYNLDLCDYLE